MSRERLATAVTAKAKADTAMRLMMEVEEGLRSLRYGVEPSLVRARDGDPVTGASRVRRRRINALQRLGYECKRERDYLGELYVVRLPDGSGLTYRRHQRATDAWSDAISIVDRVST